MSNSFLPLDVKDAVIQVCGRSFHYRHVLFDVFDRAGIPRDMYSEHKDKPKFFIARYLINDLEQLGEEGWLLQRRLLTELCNLRDLIDPGVSDRDSGIQALRKLKSLAVQHDLTSSEDKQTAEARITDFKQRTEKAKERENRLKELHATFLELISSCDPQRRGYELEQLLGDLFRAHEIRYRKAYQTEGEQIDGSFEFGGFSYIVEARWRKDTPSLQELLAFKGKVDRKIAGTRGFFISIMGFQPDTITNLRQAGPANLILMDGRDLALILEGQVTLQDGLRTKIDKASQEGILFSSLAERFG